METINCTSQRVYYRTASVAGVEIFYREAGPKDRPTLVLLHGFPTSSHMYRDLMPQLADGLTFPCIHGGRPISANTNHRHWFSGVRMPRFLSPPAPHHIREICPTPKRITSIPATSHWKPTEARLPNSCGSFCSARLGSALR